MWFNGKWLLSSLEWRNAIAPRGDGWRSYCTYNAEQHHAILQPLPGSWRLKKMQTTLFLKWYKNTLYCSKYSAPDDIMSLKHWGETLPLIFIHVPLCRSPRHLCICPHLKLLSALCEGVGWLLSVGDLHLNDKTFVNSLWQNKADRSLYKDERKKKTGEFSAALPLIFPFILLFCFIFPVMLQNKCF